jgi:hypothetical protein
MAKKLSGIAYGQKNLQKGANDTTILVALKKFIREEFGLDFKREWYVGFDKEYGNLCRISESVGRKELERFKWKNPDLLCVSEQFGVIIVELDALSLTVQSMIEKYKKLSNEMSCFEEQVSNLLSSILPILKSSEKQSKTI